MDAARRQQLEDMLETIETAITELVAGKTQSYRIGERWFTYHSIADLVDLRKQILKELNETPITVRSYPYIQTSGDIG